MDLEIGHVHLSVASNERNSMDLTAAATAMRENEEFPQGDDSPIVDWHTDSYPFVCVTTFGLHGHDWRRDGPQGGEPVKR